MRQKTFIIIPIYNSEHNIEYLVEKLIYEISKDDLLENVLVNDC